MGFFDEAKHKLEEVAGRVEKFVGEARGDVAMQFEGEAHAEHGEALQEQDDAEGRTEHDKALQENRDEEQARTQAARAEHDQRKLQDPPSGDGMRRAET